jgi:hypothetical protein
LSCPQSFADERDRRFGPRHIGRIATLAPSLGEAAAQNQPRHAFRMANGVRDRHGNALRDAQERKPLKRALIDDGFEVVEEPFEGEVGNVPLGETRTAFVVANELALCSQPAE